MYETRLATFRTLLDAGLMSEEKAEALASIGYEVITDLSKLNSGHVRNTYPDLFETPHIEIKYDSVAAELEAEDDTYDTPW